MSDQRYQRHTAATHLVIAAASVVAAVALGWAGSYPSIVGLLLGAITNLVIGLEKADLLRRGKA